MAVRTTLFAGGLAVVTVVSACSLLTSLDGLQSGSGDSGGGGDAATADASCEAGLDYGTDAHNCGRCGHDCFGGSCTAGQCNPVVLASGQSSPFGIAVDSTRVYWANNELDAGFASCPLDGCPDGATVLLDKQVLPADVFIQNGRLFMTTYGWNTPDGGVVAGRVLSCDPTQCASTLQVLTTTGADGPVAVVANDNAVYWNDVSDAVISTCAAQGCTTPSTFAQALKPWYGLALDGKAVYWATRPTDAGAVYSCSIGGCASPTLLGASGGHPFDLAIDATNVYWTTEDGGQVLRCPLGGCSGAPVVVADNQATPSGIAVDGSGVYWLNMGSGAILQCPVSGCPSSGPNVLAAGQGSPWEIVLDATSVYWTNSSDGRVMRLAKP